MKPACPLRASGTGGSVAYQAEVHLRDDISSKLTQRRQRRRFRRCCKTRYRPARFANRRRSRGWLAPSLRSKAEATIKAVRVVATILPVQQIKVEVASFDTQQMQYPEIAGMQYQQGELQGYQVREYLLQKWQRKCIYCHKSGIPLQVEHLTPKARGGSDRVSNLALACEPCNRKKGTQDIQEFLIHDEKRLARILAQAKAPLKDATAVNATRWELNRRLQATGLSVESGSGGQTKYNRVSRGLCKTHWL